MAAKLDRSRPFATVHGLADYSYEQDGKMFKHDGSEHHDPSRMPDVDAFGLKPIEPLATVSAEDPDQPLDLVIGDESADDELPIDDGPADDLDDLGIAALRERWFKLTGHKLRAGTSKVNARAMIRKAQKDPGVVFE